MEARLTRLSGLAREMARGAHDHRLDLIDDISAAFAAITMLLAARDETLRAEIARQQDAEERLGRERDLVGRAGGDEFVALIEGGETAGRDAARLLRRQLVPRSGRSRPFTVTVSIGQARWSPRSPARLQDLIESAAARLHERPKAERGESGAPA